MTLAETSLCLLAVLSSSAAQLCLKAAAVNSRSYKMIVLLGCGGFLMVLSMVIAVWVLQTLRLLQLVPFAAGAYVLVPLGGRVFFREATQPQFWLGVACIILGILLTLLS